MSDPVDFMYRVNEHPSFICCYHSYSFMQNCLIYHAHYFHLCALFIESFLFCLTTFDSDFRVQYSTIFAIPWHPLLSFFIMSRTLSMISSVFFRLVFLRLISLKFLIITATLKFQSKWFCLILTQSTYISLEIGPFRS